MRRVLFVTTFYPPYSFGGDAVDVQSFAGALARRGCEVTVVHDEDAYLALASKPQPRHQPEAGVEVIGLRSPLGRVGLLLTHQTGQPMVHGARLRRLCAERQFDTIVLENVSLIGGPGIFSLCPDAVRVFVAIEHWLICPTHVLWRYDEQPCDERRCLRCTLHHHRPPQLWRHTGAIERAARHVDVFYARSAFSRDKHRAYGFTPPMEVIPSFVEAPAPPVSGASGPRPHDRPYFLFVGRIERLKGLADVLPLFMTDRGADLVIAGTGAAEAHFKAQTAGSPYVRWLGFVPRHELGLWYRHALASLVPSTTYETFGIVVIEALSYGTPVIVRNRGPLPELAARGGGLVFDTPADLDAALRSVAYEPGLRDRLSADATRAFREHWCEEAVVPQFVESVARARQRRLDASATSARAAARPA